MKNKPTALQHIGIPTEKFDESVAFYESLGFKQVALKKNLVDFHIAMMKLDNCVIELYQSLKDIDRGKITARGHGHVDHIALCCDNLEDALLECRKLGYRIVSEGIEKTEIWENGRDYFIFEGPNNERIEFARRY